MNKVESLLAVWKCFLFSAIITVGLQPLQLALTVIENKNHVRIAGLCLN